MTAPILGTFLALLLFVVSLRCFYLEGERQILQNLSAYLLDELNESGAVNRKLAEENNHMKEKIHGLA